MISADPMVLSFVVPPTVIASPLVIMMVQKGRITVRILVTFISYLDILVWPLQSIGFLFNNTPTREGSYQLLRNFVSESPGQS